MNTGTSGLAKRDSSSFAQWISKTFMQRLLNSLRSPRFWMLFASMATRGAGFVTSFFIARLAGGGALGVYSSVVNTASTVVVPFSQAVSNSATIMAVNAHSKSEETVVRFARANLLMSAALSLVSLAAFYGLYAVVLSGDGSQEGARWLVLLAAASVIVAQVGGAVVQGFYNGQGRFVAAAKVSAAISALVVLAAFPAVYFLGLSGAFGLLVFASLLPLLLLGAPFLRRRGGACDCTQKQAFGQVIRRLWTSLPTVGATTVNATVSWLCSIYFVQQAFGMPGVGTVAVAAQWLTLLLMPATSWGGVTLKMLSESALKRDQLELRRMVYSLINKNVMVTFALGIVIALASGLIARAYGLQDSGFVELLCVNAVCAVVASVNNVFERLLFCLDRQPTWFVFSSLAFLVQIVVTMLWINHGVVVVAVGVLAGGMTLLLICWASMNRLLAEMAKGS
jgi:O-antigen/teichoic acid export membrane protein